jgi:SagB-type dehydrogenase family enzyme
VASWREISYDGLFVQPPLHPPLASGLAAVSVFLRYSLGLSAWKQAGPSRWALRVNPSSGNLHPTEAYIVCGPRAAEGHAGVFHYRPDVHALEERCAFDDAAWTGATAGLQEGAFLAALTSIHWREAWKYGERAFRYCQHDIGHAMAAMRMAAAMMGWTCTIVSGWTSRALAALVGVDREADFQGAEREEPACLMLVAPGPKAAAAQRRLQHGVLDPALADVAARGTWAGRASRLSTDRVQWDRIDAAAEASRDDAGEAGGALRCGGSAGGGARASRLRRRRAAARRSAHL